MVWKDWELIGYTVTFTKTGKILPYVVDFDTLEEVKHFVSQNRDCWINFEVTKKMRLVGDF